MKAYYFTARWCSPCRQMRPLVEAHGNIDIIDIDEPDGSNLAAMWGVRGLPTILLIKDGKVVDALVGATPKSQFDKFMEKFHA